MNFWKMAFDFGWVTAEELKIAVITEVNKFGEITVDEYKKITGVEYEQ